MRLIPVLAFLLVLAAPAWAANVPAHAAPAKPLATIIPGSPLANLAASLPAPDAITYTPLGTDRLGVEVPDYGLHDAGDFLSHMQQALKPGPLFDWVGSFAQAPGRATRLDDVLAGLALVLAPGLLVDTLLRLLLRAPRRGCATRVVAAGLWVEHEGLLDAEAGETEPHPVLEGVARRILWALAAFALALLPLAGFVVVLAVLQGFGLPTSRAGALAVNGAGNAYITLRIIWELLRLLIAPTLPPLRLLPLSDHGAQSLATRILVILATIMGGYILVSSAEIIGLPHATGMVLIRYAMLAVHVELALLIWAGRRPVARWLAGPDEAEGPLALLRHRLAQIWHYLALFYVVALWVAWVGGVQNAFATLLRVVVVLVVATAAGRVAWLGVTVLLDRIFPPVSSGSGKASVLLARARLYHPLLRVALRLLVLAAMVLLILQGWGLNALGWLTQDPLSHFLLGAAVSIGVTVALALALWEALNLLLQDRVSRLDVAGHVRRASRLRTLTPILRATIGTIIVIVALFAALTEIGVNAPSLAAGAGVVGIAIGFGSQKLVQDLITGLFLLAEDAMQVGDIVTLAGVTGTVEHLSIRTIRLRGFDGSVNIIPFSSVANVTNLTRDFSTAQINLHVSYEADIDRVYALLAEIAATMRAEEAWAELIRDDLKIQGLDEFGALGLTVLGQIRTAPGKHWPVRREFYRRVLTRFRAEGIVIPHDNTTFAQPAAKVSAPPSIQ